MTGARRGPGEQSSPVKQPFVLRRCFSCQIKSPCVTNPGRAIRRNKALIFFKASVETKPYFLPAGLGLIEVDGVGHLVSRMTCWQRYLGPERGEIFKLSGEFIKGFSVRVTKLLQRALYGCSTLCPTTAAVLA